MLLQLQLFTNITEVPIALIERLENGITQGVAFSLKFRQTLVW